MARDLRGFSHGDGMDTGRVLEDAYRPHRVKARTATVSLCNRRRDQSAGFVFQEQMAALKEAPLLH